jgi:1-deoxy-D-xylulose-5-phosphate synthase
MACDGAKPVVAIYSTFLQRAYDQLIHDVALQGLDVTFAIDRAGLVGQDGPTHHGAFDLSFLRCIPNMVIGAPSNENETRQMLYSAYQHPGPAAIRYPRGEGTGATINKEMTGFDIGKANQVRQGNRVAILNFGTLLPAVLEAAERLNATVADMRWVKPMDEATILDLGGTHDLLVAVEENALAGGAGAGVAEYLSAQELNTPLLMLGLPDHFIEHGEHSEQLSGVQLDSSGIYRSIQRRLLSVDVQPAILDSVEQLR